MDQIKEAQLKLGYAKETVRLYYPVSSINAMLGTKIGTAGEMAAFLEEHCSSGHQMPGRLKFLVHEGRIEISIPPEGAAFVHAHVPKPEFLADMIDLFWKNHHCTLEDIQKVFEKYSRDYICKKMPEKSDFDYVLYFKDAGIDRYYYCVKEEMGHTIYHRFTKEDYELLVQ